MYEWYIEIYPQNNLCMYVCKEIRAHHTYIPSHYLMPSYLWTDRIWAEGSETLNESKYACKYVQYIYMHGWRQSTPVWVYVCMYVCMYVCIYLVEFVRPFRGILALIGKKLLDRSFAGINSCNSVQLLPPIL